MAVTIVCNNGMRITYTKRYLSNKAREIEKEILFGSDGNVPIGLKKYSENKNETHI